MFATNIALAERYDYLNDTFKKCYEWLKTQDILKLEAGRYDICDGAFALVQHYTTQPKEKCRFEAHYAYFDIQYLAKGVESFAVAMREGLEVTEDDKKNDIVFFKDPAVYSVVNLQPGDFCVVPPEEAHAPRIAYEGKPCDVVKVVVKVAV